MPTPSATQPEHAPGALIAGLEQHPAPDQAQHRERGPDRDRVVSEPVDEPHEAVEAAGTAAAAAGRAAQRRLGRPPEPTATRSAPRRAALPAAMVKNRARRAVGQTNIEDLRGQIRRTRVAPPPAPAPEAPVRTGRGERARGRPFAAAGRGCGRLTATPRPERAVAAARVCGRGESAAPVARAAASGGSVWGGPPAQQRSPPEGLSERWPDVEGVLRDARSPSRSASRARLH